MDEKKPQHGDGLPDGVPPEALKFVHPEQAWAARLVVRGPIDWLKSWAFRWCLLALAILIAAVVTLSLTGNIYNYITAQQRVALLTILLPALLILLASLGAAAFAARRHYRKHADPHAAIRLMVILTGLLTGGALLIITAAHYLGGVGLGTMLWLAAPMFLFVAGVAAISPFKRSNGELRCAKCGYPYADAASEVCPECGSRWHEFASLTLAGPSRLFIATSVKAVLLLVVILTFASFKDRLYHLMPTTGLVAGAPLHWHVHGNMYCEIIEGRTLSSRQSRILAKRITDAPADTPMHFPMLDWYTDRILAGEIPDEVVNRFIKRRAKIILTQEGDPPPEADARVFAAMHLGESFGRHMRCHMAVQELTVAGAAVPLGRCTHFRIVLRPSTMALYEWRWPYDLAGLPPGEHTVQARYWVVMSYRSIGDSTITWRPDGTPTPPPNTLGMIPLQATTTITVPQP